MFETSAWQELAKRVPLWPILIMAVIAVLAVIAEVEDGLHGKYPPLGTRQYVLPANFADASFSIVLPEGWKLRRLRQFDPRVDRVSFESGISDLPIVVIESRQVPAPDEAQPSPIATLVKGSLLSSETTSRKHFDARRRLVWTRNASGTVRVEISRGAVAYVVQFVVNSPNSPIDDATVVNVVDSLKFGDKPPAKQSDVRTPAAAPAPADAPRFAMGNGSERQAARNARILALSFAEGILSVIVVIHLTLYRRETAEGVRETHRIMRAIRSGLPFNKPTLPDSCSEGDRNRPQ